MKKTNKNIIWIDYKFFKFGCEIQFYRVFKVKTIQILAKNVEIYVAAGLQSDARFVAFAAVAACVAIDQTELNIQI